MALDRWAEVAGISSRPVWQRVDKDGLVGPGPITAQSVFETVAAAFSAKARTYIPMLAGHQVSPTPAAPPMTPMAASRKPGTVLD